MKTFSFNPTILYLIGFIFLAQSSFSQYYTTRRLTRGADTAEIYLSCKWYTDANHVTWNGIFRSADNGKNLSVQRKTNWIEESGMVFGDSTPGALFQIAMNDLDTFGVSFDYGVTFEKRYFQDIYNKAAGCMAGELYIQGFGLYRGTDYGNNFTLQSSIDSIGLQDVGTLPGELYGIKGNNHNPLKLAYSNDYGQTFSVTQIPLPGISPFFEEGDIHRGTEPGELYIIVWKTSDSIAIFHSFDYGQTVTLQSYFHNTVDEIFCTAGRTPGSFYFATRSEGGGPTTLHSYVWIYYSSDYGVTFNSYFHDLNSTYTGVAQQEMIQEINVVPNPASDRVTFRFGGLQCEFETKITLYDLFGRPVAFGIVEKGQTESTIDTRKLAPGLYCFEILQKQHRYKGKIVILR